MQCYLYGKISKRLSVKVGKHSHVSALTGKRSKSKKHTVAKHLVLLCDHIVFIEDFKILATSESDFHVKVKESPLISCDEPNINKNETSLPLYLFD